MNSSSGMSSSAPLLKVPGLWKRTIDQARHQRHAFGLDRVFLAARLQVRTNRRNRSVLYQGVGVGKFAIRRVHGEQSNIFE
jgi:hypothetical protein